MSDRKSWAELILGRNSYQQINPRTRLGWKDSNRSLCTVFGYYRGLADPDKSAMGTVGDASTGDFECVPRRSGRRTRWTLSGRDDVEALIDRCKHLIEARNHNDLDKTVLAPLSDSSGLQRVRDRLPRQCLRHDVAQQSIGVWQTPIRALGDAVDERPRQSGVQRVLDMIVPLEGGASRLCDA